MEKKTLNATITHKELEPDEEGWKKGSQNYFGQRSIAAAEPPSQTVIC